MSKLQSGFLLIADITGYTVFLSESELEHAEDSLRSLIDLLIEHTQVPLVISRLEGDAVISYALDGSFLQGQTLVEMIENTYLAFRQALELMILNTNCTCNACRNLVNLDLKVIVHHGTFMLQALHLYASGLKEVALVGVEGDPTTQAMVQMASREFFPNAVFAFGLAGDPQKDAIPLLKDKEPVDGKPAAYVCEHGACLKPVTTVDDLRALLHNYRQTPA